MILGGTSEATALAKAVQAAGLRATMSLAGRVAHPSRSGLAQRIGGFGGEEGLVSYLREHQVSHLIDATHPFAAQMSHNAVGAARNAGVPLAALTRAAWAPQDGDIWQRVPSVEAAVAALAGPAQRVFLAIGRMHLAAFAEQPHHLYLLRLVDPPTEPLPLPKAEAVIARGPFSQDQDRALLTRHRISCVVSKNSGGSGAYAKIAAARALGLPVIMIDRPEVPERLEFHDVGDVMAWLRHPITPRGV